MYQKLRVWQREESKLYISVSVFTSLLEGPGQHLLTVLLSIPFLNNLRWFSFYQAQKEKERKIMEAFLIFTT